MVSSSFLATGCDRRNRVPEIAVCAIWRAWFDDDPGPPTREVVLTSAPPVQDTQNIRVRPVVMRTGVR